MDKRGESESGLPLMAVFLGIDLGTSATKVGVFDETGRRLALASAPCVISRPAPGWFEQDPADWWESVVACLRQVWSGGVDAAAVQAIGLSGHFTTVFLDASGEPVRPAITWQDARAVAEAARLEAAVTAAEARGFLGIELPFSPSMPPARVAWVTAHDPDAAKRLRWIAQAKDYIAARLTGEVTSDRHSMLGLVHIETGAADAGYLGEMGISPAVVPRLAEPDETVGVVSRRAADETGLRAGTLVAAGWIDAYCSMVGTGMNLPNCAFDYAGTSEIVGLLSDRMPLETRGLLVIPLKPGMIAVYGLTNSGSGSLSWAVGALGAGAALEALVTEAATVAPGCDGMLFLPYLDGERSPVWDPDVRGAFLGVSSLHRRPHFIRSVLEGVACSLSQLIGIACSLTDRTPERLMVSGGGAKSEVWSQIRADVAQLPVSVCAETETGSLGAAILASVAAGAFADLTQAASAMVSVDRVVEPRIELSELYAELQARYDKAYAAVRQV